MRYRMKQKLFALGNDFTVKDDAGNDVFFVDGKALSLGDKLSIQDMAGNEVAWVSKAFFSWSDTYGIDIEDGEDDVAILATAVVIDMVNQDDAQRR